MIMMFEKDTPRNYFICTVQRSGKSWLCGMITRLRGLGAPEEYCRRAFNPGGRPGDDNLFQSLGAEQDLSEIKEYVRTVTEQKTGASFPLGLVIQANQLKLMAKRLGREPAEVFRELVTLFDDPAIFYLKREDMAAQAVSHYFLAHTGIGHSYQENSDKEETYRELEYDQELIEKWYDFTSNGYRFWEELFRAEQIVPVCIRYEDLQEKLFETLAAISQQVNESAVLTADQVATVYLKGLKKLPVSKKEEFTQRFRESLF